MDKLNIDLIHEDLPMMLNEWRVTGFRCGHVIHIGVPDRFDKEETQQSIKECPICSKDAFFAFDPLSGPVWWAEEETIH